MNTGKLKYTDRMWAGLNRPGAELKDVDVAIFGIPFDGGVSFRAGAKEAPDTLRNITYTISPTTEDFMDFSSVKILDLGNVDCTTRGAAFKEAEEITKKILAEKKFFIMIGGDHSVTIPVHKGVDASVDSEFGIIHIDAHFDLCDSQDGDRFSHGSTERRALELQHVSGVDNLFFVGVRSIESDELDFFHNNKVNVLSSKHIDKLGTKKSVEIICEKMSAYKKIYITLDIDCLDPGFAGGTGTPKFGGMTPRELLNILEGIFSNLDIIGMDIVEVAPKLDDSLSSLFAARRLITECIGHKYRTGGFK